MHTMSTPHDTVRTWREVVDQLTAARIAQLERLEPGEPQTLLETARQWAAKQTTAAAPFDHVAPPAGAVRTFGWQLDSDWFRDPASISLDAARLCCGLVAHVAVDLCAWTAQNISRATVFSTR